MTSPRITFTYSGPTTDSLDLLQIEQSDWLDYTGQMTKSGMVLTLRELLYGEDAGQVVDCETVDGSLLCLIDVYPLRPDLVYQFATSYGSLSDRREVEIHIKETINFSLTTSVTPDHPPLVINRAVWLDEVYDVEGNEIAPPPLMIVDRDIISPIPVYGSVEVSYTTERHSYTLTVPRRTEAIDNFYSAAVYGWYEGGVDWLVLEMPPWVEEDLDAICGGAGSVEDPEDPEYEPPVAADRYTVVDYCTQEILEDHT